MSLGKWVLDQTLLGNCYHAASAGAVTTSTVSATSTGLAISNPWGSGKNLVIVQVRFQMSIEGAAASVTGLGVSPALSTTQVVHTTPMVIHNGLMSGSDVDTGVGLVDAAATLPAAPVWLKPLGGAIDDTLTETVPCFLEESNGSLILPPGADLSLMYLTTATVGIASIVWVEIDQ